MTTTAIELPTKNDIAESTREAMIELLQQSTADSTNRRIDPFTSAHRPAGP